MDTANVVLGLIATVVIATSVYSTIITMKDDHYSGIQRVVVIAMCWLLPLIGPAMAIVAYRSNTPTRPKKSKNGDINRPNSDYIFIPGAYDYDGDGGGDGGGD